MTHCPPCLHSPLDRMTSFPLHHPYSYILPAIWRVHGTTWHPLDSTIHARSVAISHHPSHPTSPWDNATHPWVPSTIHYVAISPCPSCSMSPWDDVMYPRDSTVPAYSVAISHCPFHPTLSSRDIVTSLDYCIFISHSLYASPPIKGDSVGFYVLSLCALYCPFFPKSPRDNVTSPGFQHSCMPYSSMPSHKSMDMASAILVGCYFKLRFFSVNLFLSKEQWIIFSN